MFLALWRNINNKKILQCNFLLLQLHTKTEVFAILHVNIEIQFDLTCSMTSCDTCFDAAIEKTNNDYFPGQHGGTVTLTVASVFGLSSQILSLAVCTQCALLLHYFASLSYAYAPWHNIAPYAFSITYVLRLHLSSGFSLFPPVLVGSLSCSPSLWPPYAVFLCFQLVVIRFRDMDSFLHQSSAVTFYRLYLNDTLLFLSYY